MCASGWQLLDAIHFSGSLLGILYSLIVLDKCNCFCFPVAAVRIHSCAGIAQGTAGRRSLWLFSPLG